MKLTRYLIWIVLSIASITGQAATVTYDYSGVFNEPSYSLGPGYFGSITFDTQFSVSLTYDNSQPTLIRDASDPLLGGPYEYISLSVTIDGKTVTDYNGNIGVYSKSLGYPTDLLIAYGNGGDTIGGLANSSFILVLQNLNGGVFPTPSLLGANLSVNNFTLGNGTFLELDNVNFSTNDLPPDYILVRGELSGSNGGGNTSPTPIPSAIWLVGSALAGVIGFGRRKFPV